MGVGVISWHECIVDVAASEYFHNHGSSIEIYDFVEICMDNFFHGVTLCHQQSVFTTLGRILNKAPSFHQQQLNIYVL